MSLSTIRSSLFLVLLVGKPNFTLTRSFIFVHSLRLFLSTSSASGFLFATKPLPRLKIGAAVLYGYKIEYNLSYDKLYPKINLTYDKQNDIIILR